MRKFERYCSACFEYGFETSSEVVDVRHMSKYVVAGNKVRLFAICCDTIAQSFTKKFMQHWDTKPFGGSGCAGCGFDAKARDTSRQEIFQLIAIVRCDFNNMAGPCKTKLSDHGLGVIGGMR